jgi:hypothetical protein
LLPGLRELVHAAHLRDKPTPQEPFQRAFELCVVDTGRRRDDLP